MTAEFEKPKRDQVDAALARAYALLLSAAERRQERRQEQESERPRA